MSNSKNIIIAVLLVALVSLAGWTYYTLSVTAPQKAEAACKATIDTVVIPQVTDAVQKECTKAIGQYQQLLGQLQQVPACAAVMPQ